METVRREASKLQLKIKPKIEPWQKVSWTPEQEQSIYRNWGLYFTNKQLLDYAADAYDKLLQLRPDDAQALIYRGKCRRSLSQTQGALEDALEAAAIDRHNARINLEICDSLYDLNRFEDSKIELHRNIQRFRSRKGDPFRECLIIVDENFNDNLGKTLQPFILKNQRHFDHVREQIEHEKFVETRPLWKVMKEQDICDVESILQKEEEVASPLELARRERSFRIFNQFYFNDTWSDVLFLRNLRHNKYLMLPESKSSTPILRHITHTKYEMIKKFSKMLQARSPIYNELSRRYPNKEVFDHHRENHLNRVQYMTRHNMLTVLRSIRKLRDLKKLKRLTTYIESVMGDYVVMKTHRVMPWKFEFINEVYNTLALAHTDCLFIPEDIMSYTQKDRILVLLNMDHDKLTKEVVLPKFVFGKRSTYREPDAVDYSQIVYKNFLNRLDKRLRFVKYPIEKCYLLHEIARSHMEQTHYDDCCAVARKAIEECKRCNSILWEFLNIILICKCYSVVDKVERAKAALKEAYDAAVRLNSPRLIGFMEICQLINEEEINTKKEGASMDSLRAKLRKSLTPSAYRDS